MRQPLSGQAFFDLMAQTSKRVSKWPDWKIGNGRSQMSTPKQTLGEIAYTKLVRPRFDFRLLKEDEQKQYEAAANAVVGAVLDELMEAAILERHSVVDQRSERSFGFVDVCNRIMLLIAARRSAR